MPHPSSPLRSLLNASLGTIRETVRQLFPAVVHDGIEQAVSQGWRVSPVGGYCHRCGAPTGPGELTSRGCSRCAGQPLAWDHMIRLGVYEPPLSSWIVAMKFHRQWSWAPQLGRMLAQQAGAITDPQRTIVCDVPSPFIRRWRRGYSQTRLMADAFAAALGVRRAPILHRKGWQRPQMSLPASLRLRNVRDAFRLAPVDLTGCEAWLVDDIKTTGSTLVACAQLLREAGAARIHVAVAAVGDPRKADFKLV